MKTYCLAMALCLIAACGGSINNPPDNINKEDGAVTNTTLSLIKSSIPSAGATSVAIDSSISVIFDETVKVSLITDDNVQIVENGMVLSGKISASGTTLTFNSDKKFDYDSLITVSFANLTNIKEMKMDGILSFSFTTAPAPDETVPFVISSSPDANAENVPVNTSITIKVSEDIVPENVEASLSGELSYSKEDRTFTFKPETDLPYSSKITFVLSNVMDITGNSAQFELSFTTSEEVDTTPPPYLELFLSSGSRGTITWQSVGETSYLMKKSSRPLSSIEDFDAAETVSGLSSPKPAGEMEKFNVSGLGINETVYIAIRVFDASGNSSEISSIHLTSSAEKDLILEDLADSAINDYFGYVVTGNCDINNDGTKDHIISSPFDDISGVDTGRVFVFLGDKKIIINGVDSHASSANDYFGYSISCSQDFNGDGFDDILIGAPMEDTIDGAIYSANSGAAYLFYGKDIPDGSVLSASQADVIFQGRGLNDRFGNNVSGAHDLNNDGFGDIAITAPWGEIVQADEGVIYIYYGKKMNSGSVVYDVNADVKMAGVAAGTSGGLYGSIESGDIDGDNILDLVFIAGTYPTINKGTVYVWFGKNGFPSYVDIGTIPPDVTITGENKDDYFGTFGGTHPTVSAVGDINNDGIKDLVIGAANFDPSAGANAGSVFVFYGRKNWNNVYTPSNADLIVSGALAGDLVGSSIDTNGDYNKDGIRDLLIGASGFAYGGGRGAAFVIYGHEDLPVAISILEADVTITHNSYGYADIKLDGLHSGDYLGSSLAFIGDTNGDGYDDILIGAYGNETTGRPSNSGAAYLIK